MNVITECADKLSPASPLCRVVLACLWHETNTFVPAITGLQSFLQYEGEAVLALRGDGSQIGAALDLAPILGWNILPGPCYRAKPSGPVENAVIDAFEGSLTQVLQSALPNGLDGVLLFLHGAMVAVSESDVAGRVVSEVRRSIGPDKPIAVVIDPHANVSARLARECNLLYAYRENPHTDSVETTVAACHMLNRVIREGLQTDVLYRRFPVMWPPPGTASGDIPLKPLLDMARSAEKGGIARVNVCPGFAHADTPDTGLSFTIVRHKPRADEARIDALIQSLFRQAQKELDNGFPNEWKLSDAMDAALSRGEFPCLLVEPSDNVGGGTPGDGTWVLRQLLDRNAGGSGVVICDPEAVEELWSAREGQIVRVAVGGKSGPLTGGPVALIARVVRKSNGNFSVEDRNNHTVGAGGYEVKMGRTVLLESHSIWILLNSIKTMPVDLGQWRCVGINPEQLKFIGIKAAVAHRQAYLPITKQSFTVSTPGPCQSDLTALPYQKVRRPVYPLDPVEQLGISVMLP